VSRKTNRLILAGLGKPYVEIARELGIRVELDGDLVLLDYAAVLEPMAGLLRKHEDLVCAMLERECGRIGMYCHGGPLDGKRSGIGEGSHRAFHIGRGQWACYVARFGDDGRATYIGLATSQTKARRKFYVPCKCGHSVGQCFCLMNFKKT